MKAKRPSPEQLTRPPRWAAMVHGGSGPGHLALAVTLGLAIGFTAGWNFCVLLLLALAALLNAHSKLLGIVAISATLMAWLATPVTVRLGTFLFDETPVGKWILLLGDGPWVAMFDLDRYSLVGGLVLAALLAGPLAHAAWQLGKARCMRRASGCVGHNGLFRRKAWLAVPAVVILGGALSCWLGTRYVERRILALLSEFNGAEVSAARIYLAPWSGHLEVDGLEIPDPSNLERDRLRIARLRADLRAGPLLRGRFETDRLILSGVDYDVARRKAATAVATHIPQIRISPEPLNLPADPPQELELHDYICGWDRMASRLTILGQLLTAVERFESLEPAGASPNPLFHLAGRSNLGCPRPAIYIERLVVEDLGESWGLGSKPRIELSRLSTCPKRVEGPASLRIVLPQWSVEMHSTLDFPGRRHSVQVQVCDLPLASLVERSGGGSRWVVEDGRVTISGEGLMDDVRFELTLEVQIADLRAKMQGTEPAAGILPATWNRGLAELGNLRTKLVCDGRWSSPRLHVQARDLVDHFKHQLRSAGNHGLLASIDEQLAAPARTVPPAPIAKAVRPLPTPEPSTVATANESNDHQLERLPQPAPKTADASGPGAGNKASEPCAPAGSPRQTASPAVVVTDAAREPPATTQALMQPRDVQAETASPYGGTPQVVRSPSPMVTVSDELFGPPPLAVVSDAMPARAGVAPLWQPPSVTTTPNYRPPPSNATYAPPPVANVPRYSPPNVQPPRSKPVSVPGPVNMQVGLDQGARTGGTASATAAPKPKPVNRPAVPTPKQLLAQYPSAAPQFFRQPTAQRNPATSARKTPTKPPGDTATAQLPWYKRLWQ